MKLIIGLGNPGKRYENTRHNFGFHAIDHLREEWDFPPFSPKPDFSAQLSEGHRMEEKVLLAKPETYMNDSGRAVAALVRYFKIEPKDITVIHDDLDIPFGEIRVTESSRAAGHNGVQSIIDALGTQDFRRIRLGIGRPENPDIDPADFVLQPFPEHEAFRKSLERVPSLVSSSSASTEA